MLHHCSNTRCPDEAGLYKQKFPFAFINGTKIHEDGWPEYRRRECCCIKFDNGKLADNSSVAPYNAALLLEFDAHINVHVCARLSNIKYLYKYLQKGKCTLIYIYNRLFRFNILTNESLYMPNWHETPLNPTVGPLLFHNSEYSSFHHTNALN